MATRIALHRLSTVGRIERQTHLPFPRFCALVNARGITDQVYAKSVEIRNIKDIERDYNFPFEQTKGSVEQKTFRQMLQTVTVSDMLNKKEPCGVITIDNTATAFDAIKVMSKENIGCILVIDPKSNQCEGIFTERDYIRKLIIEGKPSTSTPIRDVMTKSVIGVTQDQTLDQCGAVMASKKFRHLPVIQQSVKNSQLVGVVSARDVSKHMVSCAERACDMRQYKNDTVSEVFNFLGRRSSTECYVQDTDTVYHALEVMKRMRIGAVMVFKQQDLVGIFTERDYLHRIILQDRSSKNTAMSDVMTTDVITVPPNAPVHSCLRLMAQRNIRTLPVVPLIGNSIDDSDRNVAFGMINFTDVVKFLNKIKDGPSP